MDASTSLPLVDRLRISAALWAESTGGSLARLGKAVVNDGGFFTRLETQPQGTTTATLEKFARFLIDPANWPEDADGARCVPGEVVAFGHVIGVGHRLELSGGATRDDGDTLRLPALSRGTLPAASTRETAA